MIGICASHEKRFRRRLQYGNSSTIFMVNTAASTSTEYMVPAEMRLVSGAAVITASTTATARYTLGCEAHGADSMRLSIDTTTMT